MSQEEPATTAVTVPGYLLLLRAAVGVLLLFLLVVPARAEPRTAELGRIVIDVDPVGGAAWFAFSPASGPYTKGGLLTLTNYLYKVNLDVAGRVARGPNASTFVGLGLKAGGNGGLAELEPRFFVMLAMDKLRRPLVPFVRFSVGGGADILYRYDHNGAGQPITISTTDWSVWFETGVGFHYFVTRHVGVGAEANFAIGPFIVAPPPTFSLYGDLLLSMRFTL
jgi:hypothetical protein